MRDARIFAQFGNDLPYHVNGRCSSPSHLSSSVLIAMLSPAVLDDQMRGKLLAAAQMNRRFDHWLQSFFPDIVFRNANWNILLACFIALLEGKLLCVKQMQSIIEESHTAVLRHIDILEAHGLIGRQRDPIDGRRTNVLLSERGVAGMVNFLDAIADLSGGWPDIAQAAAAPQ